MPKVRMRKTRGLSPSFFKSMRRQLIYEPITKARGIKKPSDLLGSDGGRVPPMAYLVTPTGVEPVLPP